MFVISKRMLREFWEAGHADSKGPLEAWHIHVSHKSTAWASFAEVKATFAATASLVGNCVVFNIGGNTYRLITRIIYPKHRVYILKVMTHSEYNNDKWKDECRCFEPPPKSSKAKLVVKRKIRGA